MKNLRKSSGMSSPRKTVVVAILLLCVMAATRHTMHSADKYEAWASSEQPGEGSARHAVDADMATYWHTRYGDGQPQYPHFLALDLGIKKTLYGFVCVPRQVGSNGRIARYSFYVSMNRDVWGSAVAEGTFADGTDPQKVIFSKPATGRYVKLIAHSEQHGGPWASITDLDIITDLNHVPFTDAMKPLRARSVHLRYEAPNASYFYNEMIIDESVPGSYFMACGFAHGYFGMQEDAAGKREHVLFSIWDQGNQNNADSVNEDKRVRIVYRDPDVTIGRFGGEGTGGQCYYRYRWATGKTYKFLVKAEPRGRRTEFSAFLYRGEQGSWKHLVTFDTLTGGEMLSSYYSFVEDFRRDFKSHTERRSARWQNGWVITKSGVWNQLTAATFTADEFKVGNIDAGIIGDAFYLATGGSTKRSIELGSTVRRAPAPDAIKPALP